MGIGVEPGTQQLLYTTESYLQSPVKLLKNKQNKTKKLGKIADYSEF